MEPLQAAQMLRRCGARWPERSIQHHTFTHRDSRSVSLSISPPPPLPSSSRRPRQTEPFPPRAQKSREKQPARAALASNQAKRARNREAARPCYTYAVAGPARSAVGPPATNLVTCPAVPVPAGQRDSGLDRSIAARAGMADIWLQLRPLAFVQT